VIADLIGTARRLRSAVSREVYVIIMKLAPAALLVVLCSASPLLAQTAAPAQAPAPAAAPSQTPAVPAVQTPPAAAPAPMEPDHTSDIALLDRIQKVLDTAVDEQRAKGATVTIDRGLIDELRAEVTQVRMSLQGGKTPQGEKK
jgi:hypothetical protein